MTVRATATLRPAASAWRAGRDGVGHAIDSPRALRTACGERPVDERLAWPIMSRCLDCLEVVGIVVPGRVSERQETLEGWTEGELAESWGR